MGTLTSKILMAAFSFLASTQAKGELVCEALEKMPLVSSTKFVKVEYGDKEKINITERCSGAKLKLTKTKSTFSIRDFQSDDCGTDWVYRISTYTYKIIFEDDGAVYYDLRGGRHPIHFACTTDEIFIDLPPHEMTWWNSFRPGQWRIKISNDIVSFDWIYPTFEDHYMRVTADLSASE